MSTPILVTPLIANSCSNNKPNISGMNNAARFENYTKGLGNKHVSSIFASSDGNTIYAATNDGVSVGTKTGSTYTFKFYVTGLVNRIVNSIYATSDGTIIAGTGDGVGTGINGGVAIGTKNSAGGYTFKNYPNGLGSYHVQAVYGSSDGSKIYVGVSDTGNNKGGVSVGTKNSAGAYNFRNYTRGIENKYVYSIYASSNGNTIYAGTTEGVEVGTKSGSDYSFTNYAAGLADTFAQSVYASPDGNIIYAGTERGLAIGTKNSGGVWIFKNYTKGLGSPRVYSVDVSPDGNTIYAGTDNGVSVGTKTGSTYAFKNYTAGLGSTRVNSVYALSSGKTVYVGTDNGVSVSLGSLTTENNLGYLANNYQAILLNTKQ